MGGLSFYPFGVKTNFYIDGFNLYYGAVKGTPYKWLDPSALFALMFRGHQINKIRYFTAPIVPRASDPGQPQRQQMYIRALETIPNLSVHYGVFLVNKIMMPLVIPPVGGPITVEVWKTEEKGSDVNLATYLLLDAIDGDFEQAVVVSNDSDLVLPIQMVQQRFRLPVGVLNPHRGRPQAQLNAVASFYRQIRQGPLSASQFAPVLHDAHGAITKPASW